MSTFPQELRDAALAKMKADAAVYTRGPDVPYDGADAIIARQLAIREAARCSAEFDRLLDAYMAKERANV